MNAGALSVSFDEWCVECGYDADSRSAERTYRACRKIGARFARFTA